MSWDTRSRKIHVHLTLRSEKLQVHGPLGHTWKSKSIFSRSFPDLPPNSRSFEPLFDCEPPLGMVENVCYITWTARFGQVANDLDDLGFDSGFMIAMYSFVPMGFQAWIDFIRGMLVIDWCLLHSPRPNHRFAAPCRVRLELVSFQSLSALTKQTDCSRRFVIYRIQPRRFWPPSPELKLYILMKYYHNTSFRTAFDNLNCVCASRMQKSQK